MSRSFWSRKRILIPVIIIVLLIIARMILPYFVTRYVNKVLDDIPGYVGHVDDIDLRLWRGAYRIHGLTLDKANADHPEPLLDFPTSEISIEWKSLLKGQIVSEIELHQPRINYVLEDQQKEPAGEDPEVHHWTEALKDLVPIAINRLQVNDGSLSFIQMSANPQIDLMMQHLNLQATNLRNVQDESEVLPSTIHAAAVSFGDGHVVLDGRINLMKEIPDMDIDFSLQQADVTALNDMALEFAGVDFSRGTFELFIEVAIADAYLNGYIKPMFIDTELLGEEDTGFFETIWEGFVGAFKFLFKNKGTDTLATRAPLEGDLSQVDTSVWTTILNILQNGWIQAFNPEVDQDIEFEDAQQRS